MHSVPSNLQPHPLARDCGANEARIAFSWSPDIVLDARCDQVMSLPLSFIREGRQREDGGATLCEWSKCSCLPRGHGRSDSRRRVKIGASISTPWSSSPRQCLAFYSMPTPALDRIHAVCLDSCARS